MTTTTPTVDTVRELSAKYSNWGRWGKDDQRGTLNHVTQADVVAAAASIRSGKRISLALPFDASGPQTGGFGRFNPIHLMFRDGGDIVSGSIVDDFYGGNDRHIRGTDDMIIMPLQSGTQWDALAHIMFEDKMYNGFPARQVTSKGAHVNDITKARDSIAGRGVLLDMARFKGVDALEPGYAITADDLEACEQAHGVTVGPASSASAVGSGATTPAGLRPGSASRACRGWPSARSRALRPTPGEWRYCRTRRPTSSSRCTASSSSRWASTSARSSTSTSWPTTAPTTASTTSSSARHRSPSARVSARL
jgi:Putative cyclase